ncbi:cation:proton antiporter [Sphingomonas sp.]|uniref:cation:proton antiporter domain-containing protein n=1 Tax=Sphingomonas sp. TaxID=28214 RepID=UPI0025D9819D|nr:cation:proton antiporter [Sphingomonas sp.]MBV9528819.1 cation:proton antiporter [Sphingomonas sp.]
MAAELGGTGLSDALTILGAAGIVIPAFARLKVSPVIGFILVGIIAGPHLLGDLAPAHPWLHTVSISNPASIEPFAELGIILLLFSAGLHISFRRLRSMGGALFGIGSAELIGCGVLIAAGLLIGGLTLQAAVALGIALALSSTALVLPITGVDSPVGRAAFAMLVFEDLALVPLLFLIELIGGHAEMAELVRTGVLGILVIAGMLAIGRFALAPLFGQAARTKNPELFLAISLLTVILASMATAAVGLSPILGALIAGVLIGETDYSAEVEAITAPLTGLALGIFLITVGMRIDLAALARDWPLILGAAALVLALKAAITGALLRASGARRAVAVETAIVMASPSETTLIVLSAAAAAGLLSAGQAGFWTTVTAIGLTVTPLLAALGRRMGRRVEQRLTDVPEDGSTADRTIIFGFGRVGQMVADMLAEHGKPYLAVDSDVDSVRHAREAGYRVLFGDVARGELVDQLKLGNASALVLTMDDPVLVARIARGVRAAVPGLPIVARARDARHAAELYTAGVTDAVPEALESSLQLSEAVLVDIGIAMGPVIASIHEKRSSLRTQIMEEAALDAQPRLRGRRLRDAAQNG